MHMLIRNIAFSGRRWNTLNRYWRSYKIPRADVILKRLSHTSQLPEKNLYSEHLKNYENQHVRWISEIRVLSNESSTLRNCIQNLETKIEIRNIHDDVSSKLPPETSVVATKAKPGINGIQAKSKTKKEHIKSKAKKTAVKTDAGDLNIKPYIGKTAAKEKALKGENRAGHAKNKNTRSTAVEKKTVTNEDIEQFFKGPGSKLGDCIENKKVNRMLDKTNAKAKTKENKAKWNKEVTKTKRKANKSETKTKPVKLKLTSSLPKKTEAFSTKIKTKLYAGNKGSGGRKVLKNINTVDAKDATKIQSEKTETEVDYIKNKTFADASNAKYMALKKKTAEKIDSEQLSKDQESKLTECIENKKARISENTNEKTKKMGNKANWIKEVAKTKIKAKKSETKSKAEKTKLKPTPPGKETEAYSTKIDAEKKDPEGCKTINDFIVYEAKKETVEANNRTIANSAYTGNKHSEDPDLKLRECIENKRARIKEKPTTKTSPMESKTKWIKEFAKSKMKTECKGGQTGHKANVTQTDQKPNITFSTKLKGNNKKDELTKNVINVTKATALKIYRAQVNLVRKILEGAKKRKELKEKKQTNEATKLDTVAKRNKEDSFIKKTENIDSKKIEEMKADSSKQNRDSNQDSCNKNFSIKEKDKNEDQCQKEEKNEVPCKKKE